MTNQFIEIPASKKSLAMRKPVFGVGINDADYMTGAKVNGKQTKCPYYKVWIRTLRRCYSEKFQENNPSYIGCSVCDDWLTFSVFKSWMEKQDWRGKEIDKDILIQGNKIYAPNNCMFVTKAINNLLTNRAAARGNCPRGVHLFKGKYMALCGVGVGKQKYLGMFDAPEPAHEAYKKAKYKLISEIAARQSEPLKSALLRYKIK